MNYKRDPIAIVTLFPTDELHPNAEDNLTIEALPGTDEYEPIPYEEWEEQEKAQFPHVDGVPDPAVAQLKIVKTNPTCWWVYLSTGKIRVCR